jgi:hypothetical protein
MREMVALVADLITNHQRQRRNTRGQDRPTTRPNIRAGNVRSEWGHGEKQRLIATHTELNPVARPAVREPLDASHKTSKRIALGCTESEINRAHAAQRGISPVPMASLSNECHSTAAYASRHGDRRLTYKTTEPGHTHSRDAGDHERGARKLQSVIGDCHAWLSTAGATPMFSPLGASRD